MPSWPTTSLPMTPLIGTLEIKTEPNVVEFRPEAIADMRRRRYAGKVYAYTAELLLQSHAEKQALDNFFANDCADGALPFDMADWVDGELRDFQWVTPPVFTHLAFENWRVAVQLARLPTVIVPDIFEPSDLFAGRDGLWYDFDDRSSLFQNDTGTTPVTIDTDPVGYITDKSGNDNHAVRGTDDTRRALWRTSGGKSWIEFDGSNDFYNLPNSLDLTNNIGHLTVFAGVLPVDNAADKNILTFTINGSTSSRASFRLGSTEALRFGGRRLDADSFQASDGATSLSLVTPSYITEIIKWASSDLVGRLNGAVDLTNLSFQTSGNTSPTNSMAATFGSNPAGSEFFSGRIYQLVAMVSAAELTADEILAIEAFISGKL